MFPLSFDEQKDVFLDSGLNICDIEHSGRKQCHHDQKHPPGQTGLIILFDSGDGKNAL